jgi:hypothetical protein
MENQYSIINQCLQLLKQSDLPTIKKLRVEIQLIQMKRLLLNDALTSEIMSDSCGEEVFEGLLNQMRRISRGSTEAEALADLMSRIGGMLSMLGGVQAQHR